MLGLCIKLNLRHKQTTQRPTNQPNTQMDKETRPIFCLFSRYVCQGRSYGCTKRNASHIFEGGGIKIILASYLTYTVHNSHFTILRYKYP